MKKKTVWLVVSCLMVLSLVLTSCRAAPVEEEEEVAPVVGEEEEEEEEVAVEEGAPAGMVIDSLGRLVKKPQYGGTISISLDRVTWDMRKTGSGARPHADLTFETLMQADWTKGPSGTGEIPMLRTLWYFPMEEKVGCLAESWERIDLLTAIYHIRPGVSWMEGAPVYGREVVADDVVYSINHQQDFPYSLFYSAPGEPRMTVRALDKYTIEVKRDTPSPRAWMITNQEVVIIPPEIEEAGLDYADWQTYIETGTGAYSVEESITDVSFSLKRNPNYWEYDPLHPENRLPYADRIKGLIIKDFATNLSALRTGKIDYLGVEWADKQGLIKTNPELNYWRGVCQDWHLRFRDTLPIFSDKRVRQALCMAIDRETLIRDLYDGEAEWYLVPWIAAYRDIYVPFEELPDEIREIYTYNPEKARQRLADAGYPDGFKFEALVPSGNQAMIDLLSICKTYYEDIGVNMVIDQTDPGEFWEVLASFGHDSCASGWGSTDPWIIPWIIGDPTHYWNDMQINDPHITAAYAEIGNTFDIEEQNRLTREIGLYILEQAWFNQLPSPPKYYVSQPWLKNFSGEFLTGGMMAYWGKFKYAWIDQELKREMGY